MTKPKILFYDFETSPLVALTWTRWTDKGVAKVIKESELLSLAFKWEGQKTIEVVTRRGEKTDKKLVETAHKLFNQADIIIAHNGDKFDKKKSNTRALFNRVKPPARVASVDTLKVAKKHFAFSGNSLDALAEYLKVGRKLTNPGIDMWWGCMNGDSASWKLLERYNAHDVRLLEGVYAHLKPWIDNHPNVARMLNNGTTSCPVCGSKDTVKRGMFYTTTTVRQRWRCKTCGNWFGRVVSQ